MAPTSAASMNRRLILRAGSPTIPTPRRSPSSESSPPTEKTVCSLAPLRPHLIWGPRDRHLIPRLLERHRRGQLRRVGDGKNLIDIIYVENAAQAHLQAASALVPGSPLCGRPYFLSQGEPVNCWDWINEIVQLAGLPCATRSVPLPVAYAAGLLLEGVHRGLGLAREPRMTRFLALQLGRSHYFDISRSARLRLCPARLHSRRNAPLAGMARHGGKVSTIQCFPRTWRPSPLANRAAKR